MGAIVNIYTSVRLNEVEFESMKQTWFEAYSQTAIMKLISSSYRAYSSCMLHRFVHMHLICSALTLATCRYTVIIYLNIKEFDAHEFRGSPVHPS